MNRLTALVRRYPVASAAVLVAVAVGAYLFLSGREQPTTTGVQPSPAATPGAAVTPAPAAPTPAPPAPAVASPAPPPQAAGRADPFSPLIRARAGAAPAPGPRPVSLPPPAPLPPPLFPGPAASPGVVPPGPPAVVRLSAGAQLIGVLGDTGRVAILRMGNQVYIVAQGEMIQDKIRVELVDANEGLVVLIEDGQRFEVRFS